MRSTQQQSGTWEPPQHLPDDTIEIDGRSQDLADTLAIHNNR
jgi:hypothetical protein